VLWSKGRLSKIVASKKKTKEGGQLLKIQATWMVHRVAGRGRKGPYQEVSRRGGHGRKFGGVKREHGKKGKQAHAGHSLVKHGSTPEGTKAR